MLRFSTTPLTTMNLKNAKIGQKYRLYLDDEDRVTVEKVTNNVITGTVIAEGIDGSLVLFGWKKDEQHPKNSKPREGINLSSSFRYGADQKAFSYSLSAVTTGIAHSKTVGPGEFDGCQCKKCHTFYAYAEPNQEDGTLICYSCRTAW